MDQTERTVSGRKFYVHVAGKTNGAHQPIVEHFESIGQIKVHSPQDSTYLLVFCPIASRVGTDISEALENMPGGKPVILVVMHHTFNPNHVVAPSSRQVANQNVLLTVDCLFYEGNLLRCDHIEIAWHEVQKALGIPPSQISSWQVSSWQPSSWWRKNKMIVAVIAGGTVVLVVCVALLLHFTAHKE